MTIVLQKITPCLWFNDQAEKALAATLAKPAQKVFWVGPADRQ